MIKIGVAIFASVFVAAVAISAVFITNRTDGHSTSFAVHDHSHEGHGSLTSGLEVIKPINELSGMVDVVVRGVPTSRTTDKRQIPARAHRPDAPARFKYVDTVQFQVSEYLKGDGPSVISVFDKGTGAPDIALPQLTANQEYVLFLESTEGSSFWGDGYIVTGPAQGRWVVTETSDSGAATPVTPGGTGVTTSQIQVTREFVHEHESDDHPLRMLLEDLKDEIGPVGSVND